MIKRTGPAKRLEDYSNEEINAAINELNYRRNRVTSDAAILGLRPPTDSRIEEIIALLQEEQEARARAPKTSTGWMRFLPESESSDGGSSDTDYLPVHNDTQLRRKFSRQYAHVNAMPETIADFYEFHKKRLETPVAISWDGGESICKESVEVTWTSPLGLSWTTQFFVVPKDDDVALTKVLLGQDTWEACRDKLYREFEVPEPVLAYPAFIREFQGSEKKEQELMDEEAAQERELLAQRKQRAQQRQRAQQEQRPQQEPFPQQGQRPRQDQRSQQGQWMQQEPRTQQQGRTPQQGRWEQQWHWPQQEHLPQQQQRQQRMQQEQAQRGEESDEEDQYSAFRRAKRKANEGKGRSSNKDQSKKKK